MLSELKVRRDEIKDHGAILEVIGGLNILSELAERQNDKYRYELDLEVIVYGRTYEGGEVGPYARLWRYESGSPVIRAGQWAGNSFYILVEGELSVLRNDGPGIERAVECGEVFGEMAVIEGDQRSTSVVVPDGSTATVLELQRPALRLLRKLPKFGQLFEAQYQRHSLAVTLSTLRKASGGAFNDTLIEQLNQIARFRVYERPHVLVREGEPITHVYFINKGWVGILRGIPAGLSEIEAAEGQAATSGMRFLGAGNCLGLEVFTEGGAQWPCGVIIQSRTELLEIPVESLRHPELRKTLKAQLSDFSEVDEDKLFEPRLNKMDIEAVRKEISTGIVDGTNLLVMDMDLCVRCGNCSLACHKVHGQSRLLRRGILIERPVGLQGKPMQQVLAPSVCLHCQDPECLTGCPTGAIARLTDGQIDIDPETCIGCGDCATQCPYNAISMIAAKQKPPTPPTLLSRVQDLLRLAPQKLPPPVPEGADLLAVKCNLCANTTLNPPGTKQPAYSCEENCPTGALLRVNPRDYFSETKNVIGLIYRDQTHAIGRNIHKEDRVASLFHRGGALALVICAVAAWWATARYAPDEHLGGTVATIRWITGGVGLAGILGELLYLARKQSYRKRRGPLRYWMLAHVYVGIITCMVLLIHGGWHSGGLLTSMLVVSFDLTILTGVVGIASYYVAPRMLTNIEGDPLLLDDLLARRKELSDKLSLIDASEIELQELIKKRVPKRLLSLRYLFKQYWRPVNLTTLLAEAREEFEAEADRLKLSASARSALVNAVETTAILRRVDALIYLHQLLKLWLAPHVVSTSIMLVLLAAHIIQVSFF